MDTLTQGLLGAAAAQAAFSRPLGRLALPVGLFAGIAADFDVVIPWFVETVQPYDYHRHFTHALAFIPVGGLLCALPFLLLPRLRPRPWTVIGAATLAYATHGLLDACTSFGTHLLWPFSPARTAWDCLPIVDPIFSLALVIGCVRAFVTRRPRTAVIALLFCVLYALLGLWQNHRALDAQRQLAERRGHVIERGRALPEPPTLLIWRSLYEHGDQVRVDTLRVMPTGVSYQDLGDRPLLDAAAVAVGHEDEELVRARLEHFLSFADGWAGPAPARDGAFADYRFTRTGDFRGLWGVVVDADADPPVHWESWPESNDEALELFLDRLRGRSFSALDAEARIGR